jgi:hypothetical protein
MGSGEGKEDISCLLDHLTYFYQQAFVKFPSKQKYIKKMLFMLHSLQEPFNSETLR